MLARRGPVGLGCGLGVVGSVPGFGWNPANQPRGAVSSVIARNQQVQTSSQHGARVLLRAELARRDRERQAAQVAADERRARRGEGQPGAGHLRRVLELHGVRQVAVRTRDGQPVLDRRAVEDRDLRRAAHDRDAGRGRDLGRLADRVAERPGEGAIGRQAADVLREVDVHRQGAGRVVGDLGAQQVGRARLARRRRPAVARVGDHRRAHAREGRRGGQQRDREGGREREHGADWPKCHLLRILRTMCQHARSRAEITLHGTGRAT